MMSRTPFVRPPRVAIWLVDLFTPDEEAEAIQGDLLEEFSELALKSGVASARRWCWRQSVKTIAHLIGTGFRVAPWSVAGAVVGGFLLLAVGASLPEQAIVGVIHVRRHHVTPYYDEAQLATYLFWLNTSILIGRLLMSLIIGSFVALAAKGREMVVAMTLALVSFVMTVIIFSILVFKHQPADPALLPTIVVHDFSGSCMIAIGGVIVRESRAVMSHRRPLGRWKLG